MPTPCIYTCGSRRVNEIELWWWVDANGAGDTDTTSVTHRPHLDDERPGGLISWKSCQQDTASLLTSEAKCEIMFDF